MASASDSKPAPPLDLDVLVQVIRARLLVVALRDLLTSTRAYLHANAVETADADATRCCLGAGTPCLCSPCPVRLCILCLTRAHRQCTKAGVECMFYDHGRNDFLRRRYGVHPCYTVLSCLTGPQLHSRAGRSRAAAFTTCTCQHLPSCIISNANQRNLLDEHRQV